MAYNSALKRLPDPTTTPEGPGFVTQQIIPVDPGMIHDLNTGGTIGVQFEGSYWIATIAYPQLTMEQADVIIPFLSSLRGSFTNFYVSFPTKTIPKKGRWPIDAAFTGSMTRSNFDDRVLVVAGQSARLNDFLSPGDFVKISNSNKIYMVTGVSAQAGDLYLELNCPILNPTTLLTASLWVNDVKMRVRLSGQFTPPTLTADGLYDPFSIQVRENIL